MDSILKTVILTNFNMECVCFKKKIWQKRQEKEHLTTMFTRSQEIDDVWVVAKFTENLQFPSEVPVVIFGGIFWE